MTRIEEARGLAAQAKAAYQHRLTQIDSILRAEVSRDPATLRQAEVVQSSYSFGLSHAVLAPNEQPAEARVVKKIKGGK